jgi:Glycine rich protein
MVEERARAHAATRRLACAAVVAVATLWPLAGGAQATTVTFASTGTEKAFTVPAGVTMLHVVAVGGRGGGFAGGFGANASGDLPVTGGQVLYIDVGANGVFAGTGSPVAGSFNGGGGASYGGGSGGGASDVRGKPAAAADSLASRLIVAAGGGGVGGTVAGGAAGEPGGAFPTGGGPGTATAAGGGGRGNIGQGGNGALGRGGDGGWQGLFPAGGGGGGGLYGGGGGAGANKTGSCGPPDYTCAYGSPGGGGGGSSFFSPAMTKTVLATDTIGTPLVTITDEPPSNRFTLTHPSANVLHTIALTARVRAAGKVEAVAKMAAGRYGKASGTMRRAGTVTLRIKPTALAKRVLANHARVAVTVRVTFKPIGAKARTTTAHLTVKGSKPRDR